MRGKRCVLFNHDRDYGITPACAGKTSGFRGLRWYQRDHPRACGENFATMSSRTEERGSPPRMRGKHVSRSSFSLIARIPPAHAGKTHCDAWKQADCRDHPRACGENSKKLGNQFEKEGSSPRMRGKQATLKRVYYDDGIIPAHAGKTRRK